MNATVTTMRAPPKAVRKIEASMSQNDAIAALEKLIRNPPATSEIIEFSPKLSEYILKEMNRANRKMKPGKIKEYVVSLQKNEWGLTGDTIKFGSDSLLKDGQNRLSASVRANKPIETHVVFGIDPKLFARIDIGKNRTGADVFKITGVKYPSHVSASVRWLLIFTTGDPDDRGAQYTNEVLLKHYREKVNDVRLEQSIQAALAVRKTCRHPVGPLSALHYLFADRDQRKADAFFDEWATGRAKGARAPTRKLQQMLAKKLAENNNRIHENVRNALIVKAWDAYVKGKSVSKADMEYALTDPFPKIAG